MAVWRGVGRMGEMVMGLVSRLSRCLTMFFFIFSMSFSSSTRLFLTCLVLDLADLSLATEQSTVGRIE